ncbi:hypothetical protein OnM2_083010 [Erysiphe neolycopersici]|uniref:Uncharacterized protein n=1 Tax=Erysiphe neolycopersici TaxID=212602 RepID=A0A420HFL1_9PEZI|nr:hypothetical protein OnM2_083010 [Erysiphe neolycopersici]
MVHAPPSFLLVAVTGCKWVIAIVPNSIQTPDQGGGVLDMAKNQSITMEINVHASGLSNHRRRARTDKMRICIRKLLIADVDPKVARTVAFQQFAKDTDGQNIFIMRDIHNEGVRVRQNDVMYKLPIDMAMPLIQKDFFSRYDNETKAISMLSFVSKSLI